MTELIDRELIYCIDDEGNGYSDIVVEIEIEFDAKKSGLKPGYKVNCEIIVNEKPNTENTDIL